MKLKNLSFILPDSCTQKVRRKFHRLASVAALTTLFTSTSLGRAFAQSQEATAESREVVIVSVNDMHAALDQFPRFGFMVDSLRTLYPDLLLIGAGDNQSGNPINDYYVPKGYPIISLMNAVGFDYSTVGNHEFDSRQKTFGWLTQVASFPFLSANVYPDPKFGIRLLPSVIHALPSGVKVGLIGLLQLEEDGLPSTHPDWLDGIRFAYAQDVLPQYRSMRSSCDAVVLVNHLGLNEDKEMAKDNQWVDLIIGGHSHTLLEKPVMVGRVPITQAGSRLKCFNLIKLTIGDRQVEKVLSESITIDPKAGGERKDLRDMVNKFNDNPFFKEVIGEAKDAFPTFTSLGYFMADAHRATTKAEITFQNNGGVRMHSFPKGPITLLDVYTLDPFGNEMNTIELTPEEMNDLLVSNWSKEFETPIFASGIYMVYHIEKKSNKCTSVEFFTPDGKPLKKGHKYHVAYNAYMSGAYRFKHEGKYIGLGFNSGQSLERYIRGVKKVDSYRNVAPRWKIVYH